MLAIRAGKLIDGTGRMLEDMVVLVEGERIAKVGKAEQVKIPEGAEVIGATNKTLMPGLIDSHVHVMGNGDPKEHELLRLGGVQESIGTVALKSYVHAKRSLEAGYTAIRDAGCRDYVDVALRDAIDEGLVEGPRMKVAGQALAATGGHMDMTNGLAPHVRIGDLMNIADSPDEGRKAARYQIKMGADFIKISATLSEYVRKRGEVCSQEMALETMRAICEVAHWAGRTVAAHCHGGDGVRNAILAGVDSFEHGAWLSDEDLDLMVERGAFWVPTLTVISAGFERMSEKEQPEYARHWTEQNYEQVWITFEKARARGVRIGAGTDAGFMVPHGSNARELELLVKAGLTPMEAIVAATKTGAEVLDMAEEIGTVEEGKLADLLVVEGDPLADIRILQDLTRIKKVIKGGKVVVHRA